MALKMSFLKITQNRYGRRRSARHVALRCCGKNGASVHEYTPLQVKVAITGYGKSDKAAVAAMVPRLVTIAAKKRLDDEMDAIAIGADLPGFCPLTPGYPPALLR
jgi:Holliday junction resolvasome RuvABC endonuclease subunit